ncbi:MAG: hypothetical protein ABIQ31_27295 [Ferruginibacter sp.]
MNEQILIDVVTGKKRKYSIEGTKFYPFLQTDIYISAKTATSADGISRSHPGL